MESFEELEEEILKKENEKAHKADEANDEKKLFPKLKNIAIIGQFTDDVYRQFFVDEKSQRAVISVLGVMNKDGSAGVYDKSIEGISWESPVNLNI